MSGRVTFEEVVSLRERLAAAERRATDAEKVITALATYRDADRDYFASGISEEERSLRARRCSDARHAMFSALWHYEDKATVTAPATQPDERAAAERALIDDFGEDGSLTWVHPWYVLPDCDSGNGLEIAFCHPKDDARGRMLTAFVPLSALRCFTTDAAKEGTTEETTFERGYRWLVEATDGAAKEGAATPSVAP